MISLLRKTSRRTDTAPRRPAVWLLACACLIGLFAQPLSADEDTTRVRAQIDRRDVTLDETLTLTIVADSMTFSGQPEVSVLEDDFRILNSQESSRTNIVNGQVDSSRQWDYVLAPRHEGTLTIPAIKVGKFRTEPLTVNVSKGAQRETRGSEGFFIESDVTPRSAYVQQELIYTVKIYTAVNFLDANLEAPDIDDAQVEQLEDQKYRSLVDGRYYQVIERRYAVFPQRQGSLRIPPQIFQARVEGYRNSLLDPGKLVVKRTRGHRVKVQPPPAQFSGGTWLPARDLHLTEQWSSDPGDLKAGDSITRTVTIEAQGLPASRLPELASEPVSDARVYPDQPTMENETTEKGVTGRRTESVAVIPVNEGAIELPEIRVPWWNTRTGKREVAVIPAARLQVAAGAPRGSAGSTAEGGKPVTESRSSPSPLPWLLGALNVLLLATTVGFGLAWYRRREQPLPSASPAPQKPGERRCFGALRDACRSGDRSAIRERLLDWGHAYCGGPRPAGLRELGQALPELADSLAALDAELFRPGSDTRCDTGRLLDEIRALRRRRAPRSSRDRNGLAPLYPS